MAIMNLTLAGMISAPAVSHYNSSQQLLDILQKYRFVEVVGMGGRSMSYSQGFVAGRNYYFRKHGQCTVNFLKDGRVHVLHGPIAMWNLHDALSADELTILIAFAALSEEHQDCMRSFMAPRCKKYIDVLHHMPRFQVDWKNAFLSAYSEVMI
jgi:hypothetical protein